MSAEALRRAAALMRVGEGWPLDADEFAFAVADLLDLAATHQVGFTPEPRARLLAVAYAYLGEPDANRR